VPNRKVIAVVGATGQQGGSVASAILELAPDVFAVRALTRDPNSDAARRLAASGAEVVAADVDDAASLVRAFDGAWGAYCVTFFWNHLSPDREKASAAHMAEAAKRAGLERVIWSTLEDTRERMPDDDRMPTLMGHYKVPHFDAKAEANVEFSRRELPATFLLTSYYWDNLIHLGMGPKRNAEGTLEFVMPTGVAKVPGIAVADIGRCAVGIFRHPELIGATVGIAGQHLSGAEMAASLSRALGELVLHSPVGPEEYRHFGFPGADDLGNMFQYFRDFEGQVTKLRDLDFSRSVNPRLQTFDQWLAANAARIPLG
jgi:uncharacterized protein YbjT (DUF2867 family)